MNTHRAIVNLTAILGLAILAGCTTAPKSTSTASGSSNATPSAGATAVAATPQTAAQAESATPQSAAQQPATTSTRKQYKGTTTFAVSPEATRDPAFRTPIPDEYRDVTAFLPASITLRLPFAGSAKVRTGYGYESNAWTHQTLGNAASANDFFAIDFDMPIGTPVLAAAPGRVVTSEDRTTSDSYGNYIVIDHGNGIHSIYAHMSNRNFEVDHGAPEIWVKVGDPIGLSGKSGTRWPHLHFGVHLDSRLSHSGCDVGGKAVVPEPVGGYYGIRAGHVLTAE